MKNIGSHPSSIQLTTSMTPSYHFLISDLEKVRVCAWWWSSEPKEAVVCVVRARGSGGLWLWCLEPEEAVVCVVGARGSGGPWWWSLEPEEAVVCVVEARGSGGSWW